MTQIDKVNLPRPALAVAAEPLSEEVDAMALVRLVRRRIWLILLLTLGLVSAAIPLILQIDKVYYAQSRLLIQAPLASSLADPEAPSRPTLNLTTEVERLLARDTAVAVVRVLDLEAREEFNPALREETTVSRLRSSLRGLLTGEQDTDAEVLDPLDFVLPVFYSSLSVWHNSTSEVINIGFRSRDPELAAEVPNRLLRIYLSERLSRHQERLDAAEGWIAERVGEQRARLAAARLALQEGLEAAAQAASEGQAAQGEAAAALAERRAALLQERAKLNAGLSELSAEAAPVRFIDTEAMADLQRDLKVEEHKLDVLLRVYGDNHPDVRAGRDRIDDIRIGIIAETDRHVQAMQTRLAAIAAEEQAIVAALEEAHSSISRFSITEAELNSLREAAFREQEILDRLDQQRRTLLLQAQLPDIEAEILAPASVPLWPEGRSRLLYLVIATIAAGAVALTVACLLELLDKSVRSHQQLQGIRNLASGGLVPVARPRLRLASLAGRRPDPIFADAIRSVALALDEANGGNKPRSLVVTSTAPGEGATTIATGLALELAASGRRVLLVDANLQGGRLHSVFGGEPGPGLAEYLTHVCDLSSIMREHKGTGLHYISRGLQASLPLSERQLLNGILQTANRNGQMVIFDCAPVLASSETTLLSSLTDSTLLIVRWGRTTRHAVEATAQRLRLSAPVLTVINMVKPRRHALYGFTDAEFFARKLRRPSSRAA